MKRILIVILVLLTLVSCEKKAKISSVSKLGHLDQLSVVSLAIADNTMNEPSEKTIYVLLPPGYRESKERYPVIYYFHGQGSDSTELLGFEKGLYKAMEDKKVRPFIMVAVNGNTSLGGSFYANSPRTGRWQDHVSDELVPLIDGRYRTLASASSRGLMGFSMGGFGVLNMGLARPDTFASVWALCPGVLVPEHGIKDAVSSWLRSQQFLDCYGAAFADGPKPPVFDGSEADNALVKKWESGFGAWDGRIDAYLMQEARLKEFRIVYGKADMYPWIIEGSQYLGGLLAEQGIASSLEGYSFGHTVSAATIIADAMPFFERTLVSSEK